MFPKILKFFSLAACIVLIVSCLLPWAYYPDIHETFTGFYTFNNQYGRPGKLLSIIAVIVFVFTLLPKIWAKRANLFLSALAVGYAIKSFVLFSSCYNTICPEKKMGLFIMLIAVTVMLLGAVFPDMKIVKDKQ